MKALGATGADVFAVYCAQIMLVALFATLHRRRPRRGPAVRDRRGVRRIIPLPVAPALHPAVLVLSIAYGLLTALAFALWPLGRAHDISVSMLFRDQVAAERRLAAPALHRRDGVDRRRARRARDPRRLRPPPRGDFRRLRRRRFRRAAAGRDADDGARAPSAAPALDAAAACHRQHPPAGRADADRRALARARPCACWSP